MTCAFREHGNCDCQHNLWNQDRAVDGEKQEKTDTGPPTPGRFHRRSRSNGGQVVYAHYGIRTKRHKLIYYYTDALGQDGAVDESHAPEWELFDLHKDPHELHNLYDDPANGNIAAELKHKLHRIQAEVGDKRYVKDMD